MSQEAGATIALPRNTALPLYRQIQDSIRAKIRSGHWPTGRKIPSEHALVAELGVSRMTVHRALRELTRDGYLERVHGLGTFVSEPPGVASLIELRNIADEIRARGKIHRAEVRQLRVLKAGKELSAQMELPAGTRLFHILLIHYQDGIPIQVENRYVNPSLVPDFMSVDFTASTPGEYLLGLFRPDEMEHVVQAIVADSKLCEMLAIKATEPCLRLRRRTWKNATVVTLAILTYPGSRYDLAARYQAGDVRDSSRQYANPETAQ